MDRSIVLNILNAKKSVESLSDTEVIKLLNRINTIIENSAERKQNGEENYTRQEQI